MKKLIVCLAVLVSGMGTATAQQNNPGSWKAFDKIQKADKLAGVMTSESQTQAKQLYKEAGEIIQTDMQAAQTAGKNDKLALLYLQNAGLHNKLLAPDMNRASQGMPFDTVQFCQQVDEIIKCFNEAAKYNTMPNAKGKVKENQIVTLQTKLGITSMLSLYYNCGAFMDALGKKKESLDYFQKYVDLPGSSPVFTKQEADSIYKASAKIYSTARFNLALQNFYLKNWDKAIAAADEALKDTANLHDLYLIKINALGEKKDSAAWQRTLVEASQRTGQSSYMQNLMYYYMQNNKIQEATELADKLVADDPSNKMNWYMKGAIELNIKRDYTACRQSFEKALTIDPDYKDALQNMGTAYINEVYGKIAEGKYKYVGTNKRIEGKASDGSYQKNKAVYDKELAEVKSYYEKAKPYLERLHDLTPDEPKRWASSLQMVYSNLGMKEKAQEMDAQLEIANQQGK